MWNSEKQEKLCCLIVLVKTVIVLTIEHVLVPGSCSGTVTETEASSLDSEGLMFVFMPQKFSVFIFLYPSVGLTWWWSNVSVICGITKGFLWKKKSYTAIFMKGKSYLSFKIDLEFVNQINCNVNFLIQLLLVTCR